MCMAKYPVTIITKMKSVPLKFTSTLSAGVNAKREKLCVNDLACPKSPLSVDGVRSHTRSKLHRRPPQEVGGRWVIHGCLFLFICAWGPRLCRGQAASVCASHQERRGPV